jgi:hypothetical protein
MSEQSITDIYNVQTNLFELITEKLGSVYLISSEQDSLEKYEKIRHGNEYYTYMKGFGDKVKLNLSIFKSFILSNLINSLKKNEYIFRGKYNVYNNNDVIDFKYGDYIKLYDGFKYRIIYLENNIYLCIDPSVYVECCASIKKWQELGVSLYRLNDMSIRLFNEDDEYLIHGYLLNTYKDKDLMCKIKLYREYNDKVIVDVDSNNVFPEPRPEVISDLIESTGERSNLIYVIRKNSFITSNTPSRDRLYKTKKIIDNLNNNIFPLNFGGFIINLNKTQAVVRL